MIRREFLATGGGLLVLARFGIGGHPLLDQAQAGLDGLRKAGWQALVNQTFTLRADGGAQRYVTLVSVRDVFHEVARHRKLEQFSLIFEAKGDPSIAEGLYACRPNGHLSLKSILLHLQPVGDTPAGTRYRSDFSFLT